MSKAKKANEYLALREAKIKRNQEQLHKLGLSGTSYGATATADSGNSNESSALNRHGSSSSSKNSSSNKAHDDETKRSNNKDEDVTQSKPIILRRSLRTRSSLSKTRDGMESIPSNNNIAFVLDDDDHDNDDGNDDGKQIQSKKRKRSIEVKPNKADNENNNSTRTSTSTIIIAPARSEAKPGTTRATSIDIWTVLHGHFKNPVFIGQQLASTGKAAVVNHAHFICNAGNTGSANSAAQSISFNKYSGVCEWKNDSLFLWVNIDAPEADVRNEFFVCSDDDNNDGDDTKSNNNNEKKKKEGMRMTWYGGSRMKAESSVIQQLITIGQKATNNTLPPSSGIVLWCRLYDRKKKTFEPYACLGRLSYYSHDDNVHPIQFVWNLIDYDVLKKDLDDKVLGQSDGDDTSSSTSSTILYERSAFQRIMDVTTF